MSDLVVRYAFYAAFLAAAGFVGIGIGDRSWLEAFLAFCLAVMTQIALYWRFHNADVTP